MTYDNNIPQTGQTLGNTRAQINTNFNLIDSVLAVNHVAFNMTGAGKHKFLQMPDQAAAPTTLANEGAVYVKSVSSSSELFYRKESNGTEIQLTGAGGVTPTILSGTFNSTGSFTDIVLLPANVYGYIIFMRSIPTRVAQLSPFFTTGTTTHGMSSRMVRNGSSDDDPVELNNNSITLNLQGRTDDFGNQAYDWRVHYWSL